MAGDVCGAWCDTVRLDMVILPLSAQCGLPTYYDAFVCYHPEGPDLQFVRTMIEKLEQEPVSLKLYVPHRDDLPGTSRHVVSARIIQSRSVSCG